VSRLTYVERRALALRFAADLPGWECVRLPLPDRNIGRVMMTRKYGYRAGFYPLNHPGLPQLNLWMAQTQKERTMAIK
jgi:hypothetical protein